ncbi:unnamed protein product [Prorocentrum cordatum]|uniref:Uncharacterized protein n=1 Tax=Prorocentrum cordatum TaxID=2364126 RepID=A0ABN9VF61_9DINO|nr:unnamed protein product [Polarella glacialis]
MVAPQLQGVSLFGPPPGAGVPAAGAWGPHSPPPGGGPCGGPPRPLGVAPGPAGVPGPRPPMQPFFGIPFPQRGQPPQFTFHRTDVPPPHMASMMPPPGSGCKHPPNPQHVGLLNAGGA